jgi:competence protein ComEC
VNPGDCSIIQHNSGRVSVIDVCCGYTDESVLEKILRTAQGNFRHGDYPTNPIEYLKRLVVKDVWRFISTHPDMDHLDGFHALGSAFPIGNFWHSGVRRDKPPFGGTRYKEADWDYYVKVRDNQARVNSAIRQAGDLFPYANQKADEGSRIDGLYILAPDQKLVDRAMQTDDMNDASYVILYRSAGGRILFTGDAHDDTFDYVLKYYADDIKNCSVLIAPHHGRKSDREHDFLDVVKPGLTLFGYAPSEHLAYGAYRSRKLPVLTSTEAGDIVLECEEKTIRVYVENIHCEVDVQRKNSQGYYYHGEISRP